MDTPLEIAADYVGPGFDRNPATIRPDPAKSRETARIYAKLAHNPNHPKIRAAYEQFKREIKQQFDHLVKSGLVIEPGPDYANSDEMRNDVARGHLFFKKTGDEMPADHPLAEVDPETGLQYNDLFRAVHDFFGHAVHPHQFGATGEIRAWAEHAKMFSKLARLAMTAETHGQNSFVNFGPHSHLPVKERPFAEQKATVLPVTHDPIKLARPGIFGRLRNAIFGRPVEGFSHGPNDGIVHKAKDDDSFVKAMAERSAVAQALQKMGGQIIDPKRHREIVDDHTRIAAWYAHNHPESPLVRHYAEAATKLGAPDVDVKRTEKPKIGEFREPEQLHVHYTTPAIGPAGKDLTDAATPLIRFVHRIWAAAHKQPEFDTSREFVRAPEPATEPVKPEKPEKPGLLLPPLPLAAAPPGEWEAVANLIKSGATRDRVVDELSKRYQMTPARAGAIYNRYLKHGAKKLARELWARRLTLARKTQITNASVDPRIAGTRLAFHLHELADHYKESNPRLAELAKRALFSPDKRPWDYTHAPAPKVSAASTGADPDPYAALGEELKRYSSPHGMAVKGWRDPNEPAVRIGAAYNWGRVQKGLALDTALRNFIHQDVRIKTNRDYSEHELMDRLEKHLDLNPKDRDDFFGRFLAKHKIKPTAAAITKLHESVRRLADRAADREEIKPNGPKGNTPWQRYFRWAQANQHARFSRITSVQSWLPRLHAEYTPGEYPTVETSGGHAALADFLEEHGDPRALLVRKNHVGNVYEDTERAAGLDPAGAHYHGYFRHKFGDGTQMTAAPAVGPKGKHWTVTWEGLGKNHGFRVRAHLPDSEFVSWVKSFDPDEKRLIVAASHAMNATRGSGRHARLKLDRKSEWISAKIAKILKDGIRGRKVGQKQAEAVAFAMWGKKHGK